MSMYDESTKKNVLIKLLNFIKYDNQDHERIKEFAGSPIVGEILEDLIKDFYPKIGKEFSFNIENDLNKSYKNFVLNGVKQNITKIGNWDSINLEIKKQIIKVYSSPIILTEDIIDDLVS